MLNLLLVFNLFIFSQGDGGAPCLARDYGWGSVVCVCNSSHCDSLGLGPLRQLAGGAVVQYQTSKAGLRLQPRRAAFSSSHGRDAANTTLEVDQRVTYQEVLGFGGAVSDATAINTFSLSAAAAERLVRAYFSPEGSRYSLVRVPIGPTDFSSRYYEYTGDHQYDTSLEHFNLTEEDTEYKIPFIKMARRVSRQHVNLFAAAWTAPQWMKDIDNSTGKSVLKPEYYQVYADYYVRFLRAYAARGLDFWGVTPQNEPDVALVLGLVITMGWTAASMREYLAGHLCPSLRSAGFGGLKVMLVDDNRSYLPAWLPLLKNETVRDCVSGSALHWYSDNTTPPSVLSDAHAAFPDKFLLYSEACPARSGSGTRVQLGNWEDGAEYLSDIIQVASHWVAGWVDWNMAVDLGGGPNWLGQTRDDASVVVNSTADEFYKQPTFYAVAHFSSFVPPGSVRVSLRAGAWPAALEGVAFLTPDRVTVVVLHNKGDADLAVSVSDSARGNLTLDIPARSMHTVLYRQELRH
ncbi:lysosomal acid glucosylceramidase-like isoform X2 [Bacillus rossius redtenbacheri]|uniref:lysosomal acid glucosylceramidase-like isoform X2 n=1 Tax=Bacillus rossius redtenbacheri TaxID=93214 RepID=UPI002FDD0D31